MRAPSRYLLSFLVTQLLDPVNCSESEYLFLAIFIATRLDRANHLLVSGDNGGPNARQSPVFEAVVNLLIKYVVPTDNDSSFPRFDDIGLNICHVQIVLSSLDPARGNVSTPNCLDAIAI